MTLNEYITVYSKSTAQNEYGTIAGTRTAIASVYARVRPMSGSERNAGDQTEGYADYRFTVLQRSDFQEADVIVWRDTDYNIKFVADNGPRERYMYIDAERGGAQ
jgi:SPP1 family predicted phage head-tail adaptor